jgi:tetratricopeptide (TPR) repeat protein
MLYNRIDDLTDGLTMNSGRSSQAGQRFRKVKDKGQVTILMVDHSIKTMEETGAILHEMGFFNHLQAENGTEALAMFNNFTPEMVIAQQNIPLINGLTLLRLVREQDTPETETIFVLYGEGMTSRQVAQAGRIGVNALIMTPCPPEKFKARLEEAVDPPLEPEDEKAQELYSVSINLIQEGKLDEALDTCQSILEIHDNAEVYYNMGYIKSLKGDLEEALECFRRATTINGHHARAHQQMGLIYEKMGRAEEARSCLEKAAEIHLDLNQTNEAEEIFNIVLKLRPDTTNVYNSLGIIYRRQGRLEDSLRAYEKALKVHQNDEYIHFNAARVHLDMTNPAMAQKHLRLALKINPDFTEAIDLLRATELGLKIKM